MNVLQWRKNMSSYWELAEMGLQVLGNRIGFFTSWAPAPWSTWASHLFCFQSLFCCWFGGVLCFLVCCLLFHFKENFHCSTAAIHSEEFQDSEGNLRNILNLCIFSAFQILSCEGDKVFLAMSEMRRFSQKNDMAGISSPICEAGQSCPSSSSSSLPM